MAGVAKKVDARLRDMKLAIDPFFCREIDHAGCEVDAVDCS